MARHDAHTNLTKAPERVAAILQAHGRERKAIQTRPRLGPYAEEAEKTAAQAAIRSELAALNEATRGQLDAERERVQRGATLATQAYARRVWGPSREHLTGKQRLLHEMTLQRAWGRAQRLLDAEPEPGHLHATVRRLAQQAAGDPALAAALRDELSLYLQARGQGDVAGAILTEVEGLVA